MISSFRVRFDHWRRHQDRWKPAYIGRSVAAIFRDRSNKRLEARREAQLLSPPIEAVDIALLQDDAFKRSVDQVREHTLLDIGRLANLWNLVQMVGPGTWIEVGTYKGGTALHLCNAMKDRHSPFYCFDPFEDGGFARLTEDDSRFSKTDFTDTQYSHVRDLLAGKSNANVIRGYFPTAAEPLNLTELSFCHLDAVVYEATRDSLLYIAPRLARRSLIVVDDVGHIDTSGVERAVEEFLASHPDFLALPMFPHHAVLVPLRLWLS